MTSYFLPRVWLIIICMGVSKQNDAAKAIFSILLVFRVVMLGYYITKETFDLLA